MNNRLGILVVGRHIREGDDTVWRHQLDTIIKTSMRAVMPKQAKNLPIATDFPSTPYICNDPRPPMRLVIQVSRTEWGPHDSTQTMAVIRPLAMAVIEWIRSARTPFTLNTPNELLIEIEWRSGPSEHHIFPVA